MRGAHEQGLGFQMPGCGGHAYVYEQKAVWNGAPKSILRTHNAVKWSATGDRSGRCECGTGQQAGQCHENTHQCAVHSRFAAGVSMQSSISMCVMLAYGSRRRKSQQQTVPMSGDAEAAIAVGPIARSL